MLFLFSCFNLAFHLCLCCSSSHSSTMDTAEFDNAAGKMTKLRRKIIRVDVRWGILEKGAVFRRLLKLFWDRILACSIRIPNARYRRLYARPRCESSPSTEDIGSGGGSRTTVASTSSGYESDESDLVSLKIGALGDCRIGKTKFLGKYVGDEEEKRSLQMKGVNVMDKIMYIQGARIACKIWDVGGDKNSSSDQVPIACKDAVAILFMFDLTSRSTLSSVIGWYCEAIKWNQTAIPILIGTKFDAFVQLPLDIQWTVVTQARAYARAMKATLFFSSATHNINVNKIFKFILAKLFNLPWTIQRNLTLGEPIVDF